MGAPEGYVCQLRDASDNNMTSTDSHYILSAGQTYKVGVCKQGESVDWSEISNDNYYAADEFIGGEGGFFFVPGRRVQDLPFSEESTASRTVQTGLTYALGFVDAYNHLF